MASITYTLHPNNQYSLPYTLSAGSARYFLYYTSEYVTSLTSISVSRSISSGTYNVRFCWTNSTTQPEYGYNSDNYTSGRRNGNIIISSPLTSDQSSNIIDSFNYNKKRQYIVIRVGNTGSSSITITSFTITANGTQLILNPVAIGDKVTVANMTALKAYMDEMATGNAARTTVTAPTAGNAISASDWTNFATKARLMTGTNFSAPTQYTDKALASYYNSYVTALKG